MLCLLANTAPVAFGSLGIPVITLAKVAGLDLICANPDDRHQLPFFSLIVPVWLIAVMSGSRSVKGCRPAILVCGGSYASTQFLTSNFQGTALVDVFSGIGTLVILAVFLRFWKPKEIWRFAAERDVPPTAAAEAQRRPAAGEAFPVVDGGASQNPGVVATPPVAADLSAARGLCVGTVAVAVVDDFALGFDGLEADARPRRRCGSASGMGWAEDQRKGARLAQSRLPQRRRRRRLQS